ncbi:MAG: dihydrodipicolinate synthase family protein [Meiothermus sp.]|nr:dihydrodipicolinate synthase family protein [Meiothermus sp.]
MKALSAAEIRGNWATLLLPIGANDRIEYGRLEAEIDCLIEARVDGIYSNGSAGEFYTQTEAEFDRVNQTLAERCERAGMPFQIGATHTSAQLALERVARAAALRPSAVQVILPDWFPPSNEESLEALSRYAEAASGIGLILYNPPHAKRVLVAQDFLEFQASIPTLVGIKVADGGDDWYAAMKPVADKLSVFVPGHHLATGFGHGVGTGAYSNVACLSPKGAQRWWAQMQTDLPGALELESRIRRFMDAHILPFKPRHQNVALDKLLAAVGGWAEVGTKVRWPYRSVDQAEVPRLREIARRELPELMEE